MTLSLEPNLCLLNKKIKETIKMFPWYKRLIEDDKIDRKYNKHSSHDVRYFRKVLLFKSFSWKL